MRHIWEFLQKIENLDMFPSKREIWRLNGRTGDSVSKRESPVQNGRVGTYVIMSRWPYQYAIICLLITKGNSILLYYGQSAPAKETSVKQFSLVDTYLSLQYCFQNYAMFTVRSGRRKTTTKPCGFLRFQLA